MLPFRIMEEFKNNDARDFGGYLDLSAVGGFLTEVRDYFAELKY